MWFFEVLKETHRLQAVLSLIFFFIHLFFQSYGDEIEQLPEVLADKVYLLPALLKESRAENTCASYKRGFKRWISWALSNGLESKDTLPARAFHVALYMASLVQSANTHSPIVNAFYSIKWFHDLFDFKSPTDSKLVINILDAAKRRLSKPVQKKEPITSELLFKMFHSLYAEGNIKNQRTICACLLAFSGFLRSEELLKLKRSDILINIVYMSLFIESSKTDKYRDGAWILISRTGTVLCPVLNLERYLLWANISCDSDIYIFSHLSATKNGFILRKDGKHLSYSNLRSLFIEAFKPHVSDINQYCLHSLRSGGATAAANKGIPDRMFKRHGRWLSESAKDGYIKDSVEERLKVSRSLGI